MEIDIVRDNLENINHLPPMGREFTAKKLSNKARAILRGYWLNMVNVEEKKAEMREDEVGGYYEMNSERKSFDRDWLMKYQGSCWRAEAYLDENKFLKKIKK
jgi:hypothetical protein